MKIILTLIFFVIEIYSLSAQVFSIGHTSVVLTDSSRNNRSIPVEIYYPADSTGDDVPLTTSVTDKFPVLSFGHGFVMTWDAYENIWSSLVPEGFIVAFPTTEGSFSPSHAEFGKDISFVISALEALGSDNTSLFYNRIDSMNCVMGHSMGGGSAFLAAQFNSSVKSLATLAPAETNPSAKQAATALTIPSLIIAGSNDCITPPATNQLPMYDSLNSNCKAYVEINGGSHCQMAENNTLCSLGEATCTPVPAISRADQHLIINRYLIPWLKYELKNDCNSGQVIDSLVISDTSIVFQKTCLFCNTSGLEENQATDKFNLFPNPFYECFSFTIDGKTNSDALVQIFSVDGRLVFQKQFPKIGVNENNNLSICQKLLQGVYFLSVTSGNQNIFRKIVKQ